MNFFIKIIIEMMDKEQLPKYHDHLNLDEIESMIYTWKYGIGADK